MTLITGQPVSGEPAKAIAVMVNLETEKVMVVGSFTDDGTGQDPRWACETLWKSVKDDWPGWEVAYVSNEQADALATQRKLWQIGMSEPDHVMPARIEAINAEVEGRV